MQLRHLALLHFKKRADYGSSDDHLGNIHAVERLGVDPLMGVLIRLQDKFARLESFARKGRLENESVDDTLQDIAVYSLIALILRMPVGGILGSEWFNVRKS